MQYDLRPDDRLFPLSKSCLYRVMEKGSEEAGIPRIRIHDLRHSHVSLLIDITYRYAHLFPTVQADMANKLNALMEVDADVS